MRLHEAGILGRLRLKHWSLNRQACAPSLSTGASSLGLTDVWTAFLTLAGGVFAATISLALEIIISRSVSP